MCFEISGIKKKLKKIVCVGGCVGGWVCVWLVLSQLLTDRFVSAVSLSFIFFLKVRMEKIYGSAVPFFFFSFEFFSFRKTFFRYFYLFYYLKIILFIYYEFTRHRIQLSII